MAFDDDIAVLAAAPLFSLMGRDALRLLSFAAERRSLEAGDLLFSLGERADGGFVVMAGTIALTPKAPGAEPVLAGRSALIGQVALFHREERPAEARAVCASEVIRITPTLMRRVLEEFPGSAEAIRAALAQDLAGLVEALDRVRARIDAI